MQIHVHLGLLWQLTSLPGTGVGRRDTFTKPHLCPGFRQKEEGQRVPSVAATSLWPSSQNNPYAKVACFQVACADHSSSQ